MGEGTGEEKIRGEDGDGKVRLGECQAEIVLHQPVQSFQTPQQDALQFGAHLLHKKRVVRAVGRLVLGGQDKLAAEEAIRMVVQRGQRTVAETEEPGVNVPLVALDTFALQVQLGLGGHDGHRLRGAAAPGWENDLHRLHRGRGCAGCDHVAEDGIGLPHLQ